MHQQVIHLKYPQTEHWHLAIYNLFFPYRKGLVSFLRVVRRALKDRCFESHLRFNGSIWKWFSQNCTIISTIVFSCYRENCLCYNIYNFHEQDWFFLLHVLFGKQTISGKLRESMKLEHFMELVFLNSPPLLSKFSFSGGGWKLGYNLIHFWDF